VQAAVEREPCHEDSDQEWGISARSHEDHYSETDDQPVNDRGDLALTPRGGGGTLSAGKVRLSASGGRDGRRAEYGATKRAGVMIGKRGNENDACFGALVAMGARLGGAEGSGGVAVAEQGAW
jgi:hypothetical protein